MGGASSSPIYLWQIINIHVICIYYSWHTSVTVIQLNGSNLVGLLLSLLSTSVIIHKVAHIGILSCYGYFESIIHSYWILHTHTHTPKERERETAWVNQVVCPLRHVEIRNGIVFSYSISPERMEIPSLAHNLL